MMGLCSIMNTIKPCDEGGGAWLVQHGTLHLGVLSSNPMLGVEIT